MSEEELRKALEIMTKPMTLEEIKNFKYTFFDNSGDEESFTLEDYLDLSNNVYNLERENQQLKLDFDLYKDNHIYKNYEVERKDKQLDKYKEVIDEVRELLKQGITFCENDSQGAYDVCNIAINREKKALEILDKAKGSE